MFCVYMYMTLPFQNRLHGHCFFGFPFFVVINVPLFVVSFFEGGQFFLKKSLGKFCLPGDVERAK